MTICHILKWKSGTIKIVVFVINLLIWLQNDRIDFHLQFLWYKARRNPAAFSATVLVRSPGHYSLKMEAYWSVIERGAYNRHLTAKWSLVETIKECKLLCISIHFFSISAQWRPWSRKPRCPATTQDWYSTHSYYSPPVSGFCTDGNKSLASIPSLRSFRDHPPSPS